MYTKRKRRQNQQYEGLTAGERLKRHKLTTDLSGDWDTPWGWVGTSVTDASCITEEHLLATCGFSRRSHHVFCANKYRKCPAKTVDLSEAVVLGEEPVKDVVIISDDETPTCSKRHCSKNPNCLNYLAQDRWEDAGRWFSSYCWTTSRKRFSDAALKAYLSTMDLGPDPDLQTRRPGLPVGLRVRLPEAFHKSHSLTSYVEPWSYLLCERVHSGSSLTPLRMCDTHLA